VRSNKLRGSSELPAQLVVVLAHTSQAVGHGMSSSVIADYDRTHRRLSAFRKDCVSTGTARIFGVEVECSCRPHDVVHPSTGPGLPTETTRARLSLDSTLSTQHDDPRRLVS
jgi:hypothetical protein